ncbi:MAG: hypothetical protein AAFN94_05260 [Pseudomonadota bacterium]
MRAVIVAGAVALALAGPVAAQGTGMPNCDKLIALFIELAKRSGETVTEAQARAEVMSENPSDADCAAMLALFPAQ